jgi:hypothetical protein
MALMLTCVFFDLRAVYGAPNCWRSCASEVLQRTQGNRIFLAFMVRKCPDAHGRRWALFGGLWPRSRSGEHRGTIDLKHSGIVPIVDLARVYALAGGHAAVNTHDRLEWPAPSREEISEQARTICAMRWSSWACCASSHQAARSPRACAPDNFLTLSRVKLRAQPAQGGLRRRADAPAACWSALHRWPLCGASSASALAGALPSQATRNHARLLGACRASGCGAPFASHSQRRSRCSAVAQYFNRA